MNNNSNNINGNELVKNTLDQIPQAKSNAKRITGLVKENGRVRFVGDKYFKSCIPSLKHEGFDKLDLRG